MDGVLDLLQCIWPWPCQCSLVPLFQNESKRETIHMKMKLQTELIFISKVRFALRLVLKKRHKRTQEWPIDATNYHNLIIQHGGGE